VVSHLRKARSPREPAANRNAFAHVSHTFTHLNLNNATYSDAAKEIKFNQA